MTQLDTDLDLEVSVSNIVAQVDINEAPSCMFESPETEPCKKLIQNLVHRLRLSGSSGTFNLH